MPPHQSWTFVLSCNSDCVILMTFPTPKLLASNTVIALSFSYLGFCTLFVQISVFIFLWWKNVGQIGEREILNFASMNLALKLRYRWRRTYYTSSGLFSRILVSFMARKFPASSSFSMSADFGIQCCHTFFLLGAVISYQAPTSRTADSRVPTCHRYTLLSFHSFWLTNKPPLTVTPAYSKFHECYPSA